jgi:hypothetical protein
MRWWLLLCIACREPAPPHATAIDAQRANVELAALTEGRTLLVQKCSGGECHRVPLPSDAKRRDWPRWVHEMTERSKIDPRQARLIEQYLVVMSRE